MKGAILDFSIAENKGVISGDDGSRYRFSGPEWKSAAVQPRAGTRVDFLGTDGTATEVYVDVGSAGQGQWVGPGGTRSDGLDERYSGLYCSSDERVLLGLCGGLAHKFGIQVSVVRFLMFFLLFFVVWFPYLIRFFLPKLPTRGVPRPF